MTPSPRVAGYGAVAAGVADGATVLIAVSLIAVVPSGDELRLAVVLGLEALKALAGVGLVAVARWVSAGRRGPTGPAGFGAAWLAALALGLSALVGTLGALDVPGVGGALAPVPGRAAALRHLGTGGWFLAVAVGHRDGRLARRQESLAGYLGLCFLAGIVLAPARLLALVGSAGWFGWLAWRLLRGAR